MMQNFERVQNRRLIIQARSPLQPFGEETVHAGLFRQLCEILAAR